MFNGTIKVGNEYELNNGEVFECTVMLGDAPLSEDEFGYGPFQLNGVLYHQDGRFADQDISHPRSVRQCVKGTLDDIDVKPGDVVEWVGFEDVGHHTLDFIESSLYVFDTKNGPLTHDPDEEIFRLISRAAGDCDKPNGGGMIGIGINLGRPPTIFRDMTDAEKGALLLADHEGAEVQEWYEGEWVGAQFIEDDNTAYRIKPEPTTETRTLYMGADLKNALKYGSDDDAYKLHFDVIDGKPCNPRFEAVE